MPAGVIVMAFFMGACASTHGLYKGFTKTKASLVYVHDSGRKADSAVFEVRIVKPVITDGKFTLPGRVEKLRSSVIPLLVYNRWKSEYAYRIGGAAMREDIGSFVQAATIEESNRGGVYTANGEEDEALVLEIEIDSIVARGTYYSEGYLVYLLVAYSTNSAEMGGERVAYSRFHYRLKLGDAVLLEDFVSNQYAPLLTERVHKSTKALRSFYNASLVEALSLTFKANIESMVTDINIFLDQEYKKLGKL